MQPHKSCIAAHQHCEEIQGRARPLFDTAEVKRYLRVDFNDDDALIDDLITAATNQVETYLGRTLLKKRYKLTWRYCKAEQVLDYFVAHLPMGPIITVDHVLDCYRKEPIKRVSVDLESNRPHIMFARNFEHVCIDYTAGYGDHPNQIPAEIRQATLAIIAELYRNRDAVNPMNLKSFIEGLLYCHIPKRLS